MQSGQSHVQGQKNEFEDLLFIPAGAEAFAADVIFDRSVLLQNVECQTAKGGRNLGVHFTEPWRLRLASSAKVTSSRDAVGPRSTSGCGCARRGRGHSLHGC